MSHEVQINTKLFCTVCDRGTHSVSPYMIDYNIEKHFSLDALHRSRTKQFNIKRDTKGLTLNWKKKQTAWKKIINCKSVFREIDIEKILIFGVLVEFWSKKISENFSFSLSYIQAFILGAQNGWVFADFLKVYPPHNPFKRESFWKIIGNGRVLGGNCTHCTHKIKAWHILVKIEKSEKIMIYFVSYKLLIHDSRNKFLVTQP